VRRSAGRANVLPRSGDTGAVKSRTVARDILRTSGLKELASAPESLPRRLRRPRRPVAPGQRAQSRPRPETKSRVG